MDRSLRNLSITTLLVIAVFLMLNHIVRRAALGDWWLVLLLLLLALLVWAYDRFGQSRDSQVAAEVEIEPIIYERHAPAQTTAARAYQPLPPAKQRDIADSLAAPVAEAPAVPAKAELPPAPPPPAHAVRVAAPASPPVVEVKVEAPPPTVETRPAPSSVSATPDDLKVIEGIGPKMEKALHAAGIKTFEQLAKASEDQINAAIKAAGMRFAPSVPTWAEQATFAARGDFAELEAFQKNLTGGRRQK